jgi:hypothetical protein
MMAMANHDVELVTVLEARDTLALALAKSALEEAGIDYIVSGEEPKNLPWYPGAFGIAGIGETPLWKCACTIQVARENEAEARALLEPLESQAPE